MLGQPGNYGPTLWVSAAARAAAVVGDVVEAAFEASRALAGGGVYRQAMVVGYEAGGPRVGRMVTAEFSRAAAAAAAAAGPPAARL